MRKANGEWRLASGEWRKSFGVPIGSGIRQNNYRLVTTVTRDSAIAGFQLADGGRQRKVEGRSWLNGLLTFDFGWFGFTVHCLRVMRLG